MTTPALQRQEPPVIAPMERFSLYAFLGLVRVMEPHTETLMQRRADVKNVADEYDSPHSRPWFVSYHGSEAPSSPESACKRYLAYRMMNFPSGTSMPPWVTTCGTVGKAGELDIADAWYRGGRLLAIPEDPEIKAARLEDVRQAVLRGDMDAARQHAERQDEHQLGFVEPSIWMTVSTDLPILPPGWRKPHIVEIKGKADEVLEEMLQGRLLQRSDGTIEKVGRGPDDRHVPQLKATIGLAHEYEWGEVTVCSGCWSILFADIFERLARQRMNPAISQQRAAEDNLQCCPFCDEEHEWETFTLEPPTTGEIYYWSRSWPRKTKSFFYEHDQHFMDNVVKVLGETRQHYINDEIPLRPDHFQWSIGPCQNCAQKPVCRIDAGLAPRQRKIRPENARHKLTESAGVDQTKKMRLNYDPHATRARVFAEWSKDEADV